MKASGNAPESDTDEIFVIHTMLILISRLVSALWAEEGQSLKGSCSGYNQTGLS